MRRRELLRYSAPLSLAVVQTPRHHRRRRSTCWWRRRTNKSVIKQCSRMEFLSVMGGTNRWHV